MHPTQRKLMKRIILFLSLQFPITYPAIAGQDIVNRPGNPGD